MAFNISENEAEICQKWQDEDIFNKTLLKNKGKQKFTFYDGPPFATGNPHYGHILAGSIKDTITRHAQFKNFDVERRAGWDTHGLPVEYEIEKELGIKNYDDIIKYGIKNYNDACRGIVLRCSDYWKKFMTRIGRWIDFENDYKTMDFDFMQSVWSVFKEMWDKNLVYQGFRVMPYSTACGTPLSNFEANSNYKLVNEESVIVKFKSKTKEYSYLVWTTTPWTLPSNMILCVNPNYEYSVYELDGEKYMICDTLVNDVFGEGKKKKLPNNLNKLESYKGSDLVGEEYEPIFNFFESMDHKIVSDNYVTDTSGTGIVHIAPAFGEEDFRLSVDNNIITTSGKGMRCPVDRNGCFTEPLTEQFIGRNVKDCDKDIITILKDTNKLFKRMNTSHQYPFCWRSDTPLIYKAVPSWFVEVTKIKDDMIKTCDTTNWVPDHVKSKRFKNWLVDAKDWGISRNRFWGTPLPIWTDGEEYICVGTAKELEQLAGLEEGSITDIHRENVDDVKIKSPVTGHILSRVEYVFDCWFESGSMPFSSQKYYLNKEINYPADFIAEGLDQTRGWFYTLLIIGTALRNTTPFKNVIVNGMVLAEDGKKMSKRLQNYPDPMDVINKYGSDALRLYLISSPAVKAEAIRFKESGLEEILRTVTIPLMNSYKFYNEHKTKIEMKKNITIVYDHMISNNIFDKWIIYKFNQYKKNIIHDMDTYILYKLHQRTCEFIEDLNNVYLKLNRDRLKGKVDEQNSNQSLKTLCHILYNFSILATSYLPYFSEYIFKKLSKDIGLQYQSVHLLSYDNFTLPDIEHQIEFTKIDCLNKVIDLIRNVRGTSGISTKMPIKDIKVCTKDNKYEDLLDGFEDYILQETNIINIEYDNINKYSSIQYIVDSSKIGKKFKNKTNDVHQYIKSLSSDEITSKLNNDTLEYELDESYFNVIRKIKEIISYKNTISCDNEVIVYINTTQNDKIICRYIAKLLASEVQIMRKESSLRPWNKIKVNFTNLDEKFKLIFIEYNKYITDIIGYPIYINSDIIGKSIDKIVDILDYTIGINIYTDSEIELNIE